MNINSLKRFLNEINNLEKKKFDTSPSEALYLIDGMYVYLPNVIDEEDIKSAATKSNFTGEIIETDYYCTMFRRNKCIDSGYILNTYQFQYGVLESNHTDRQDELPEGIPANRSVSAIIRQKEKILIEEHVKLNCFTLPGGKLKKDERAIDGIKRELHEELGINVKAAKFKYMKLNYIEYPANSNQYGIHEDCNFIVYPSFYDGEIKNMEPKKHKQLLFLSKKEILDMKLPLSVVLQEALDRMK